MSATTQLKTSAARLPPGPRLAPLQTALYMRDPYGYTRRLRQRYGDLVTMPSMNGLIILAMTSEGARDILATPMEQFGEAFGANTLSPILGEGSLLLLSGSRHRTERKLLSPTFHGNRMRALSDVIEAATLERMKSWKPGMKMRLLDEMQAISLDVIIRAVLGIEAPERRALFRVAIRQAIQDANPALFFFKAAQHRFGGLGPWARFLKHRDRLHALLNEEIKQAREDSSDERPDILARLEHERREDGQPFSDASIRDHLLTLLVAGHETTANALSWSFYELSRNPEVCEWLLGEIRDASSAPEELPRIAALEATARESLRRHPIIAEFFRPVRESLGFGDFTIPPGAILGASILEIHQDESLYPEPKVFRPSRFLERRFAPHEFAAFGGGHRHCLGSAFALAEMTLVIGTVLPRFHFQLASMEPPGIQQRNVTLGPAGGVEVTVHHR